MCSVDAVFQKNKYLRLTAALVLALCFVALMPPVQISYTAFYLSKGRYIKLGICLVLYSVFLLDTVKYKRLDSFFAVYLVYCLSIWIASLLMQSSLEDAVWTYGIAPGGMILLIKYGMSYLGKETLQGLFLITFIYGLIYLFLAKIGYGNEYTDLNYWVLARASFMNYLPVCLLSCFCMQEAFIVQSVFSAESVFLYALIGIVSGIGFYFGKSLTTISATILFAVYLLFLPRKYCKRIPVILLTFIYILVWCGLMSVETVMKSEFLEMALDKVGKSLTFSGRTPIWEATRAWIIKRPLFGYGAVYFGNCVGNEQTHNELLNILFRRGIFGFVALFPMVALLVKQVNGCKNTYFRNGLVWFVFCLMIGGLFEVYDIIPMMAMLSIVYYAAGKNGEITHGRE